VGLNAGYSTHWLCWVTLGNYFNSLRFSFCEVSWGHDVQWDTGHPFFIPPLNLFPVVILRTLLELARSWGSIPGTNGNITGVLVGIMSSASPESFQSRITKRTSENVRWEGKPGVRGRDAHLWTKSQSQGCRVSRGVGDQAKQTKSGVETKAQDKSLKKATVLGPKAGPGLFSQKTLN
jgi:hypothetical protein